MLQLPRAERRRAIEAAFELTRASVELRLRPSARSVGLLGSPQPAGSDAPVADDARTEAMRTGHAIARVSARLPWEPTCLRQALAAQRMLRRRQVPSTLHIGVTGGQAAAHAWLCVGGVPVVGQAGHERYLPLVAFE